MTVSKQSDTAAVTDIWDFLDQVDTSAQQHAAPCASPGTLSAAHGYLCRGWAVVPIPPGQKAPRIKDWPNLRLASADLPKHFSAGGNIGLLLGAPSADLTDVDLDSTEALALADTFLLQTSCVFGRASKPRAHRLYVCEPPPSPRKFSAPDGTCLVELRSTGQQTVAPASTHPSGEVITWASEGEPARVDGAALSRSVARVAAAALFARYWPGSGRHEARLALSGVLARAGWAEEEAITFVRAVVQIAQPGDHEACAKVAGDTRAAFAKLQRQEPVTGLPRLAEHLGDDIARQAARWLGLGPQDVSASCAAEWPEPAPLGDELLPVPALDLELLPSSLRPLVADISELMQTPPDYAAAAAIVSLAGCVNRRALITPKCQDKSWRVVPNLWGAMVAPPGTMKSPIFHAVTLPLVRVEEKWRAEFESACNTFATEKEQTELRWQAWREAFKQAVKKGEVVPVQPDKATAAPLQKRLVLTDATFEKLHEILAQNPVGVLVTRDELTGWLSELDRIGREGERAFFLEAWNGNSGHTIDRIGRGSTYVPAVCVSLFGNIQPARLRWYLSDALTGGPNDDGLCQRFQVLVYPDPPHHWKLVDRPANHAAQQAADDVFSTLVELSADDPVKLAYAPDAQELFFAWWGELEAKIRGNSGLAPALVAHLAKYRSLMPSLAGLFELADAAAGKGELRGELLISLAHAKQAAALCEYLEYHARRLYACAISPETRAARELARHIQERDLPSPFATRAVYLKGWSGLDGPESVREALSLLEDAGWVRRADLPTSRSGGRPSEEWVLNPKVTRHA